MTEFKLKAKVRCIFTDYIDLHIKASSEDEALRRAKDVLSTYPAITDKRGKSMPYMYVDERYREASEIISIRLNKDEE